jgi:lipopolysaccharide export system permease protein
MSMRILDKYLARSYLLPLVYCLSGFSLLFIVFDLFNGLAKFLEAKVTAGTACFYYLCLLIPTFEYITPASMMLATLYAMWYLTKNNELTAMRASGVSFFRICLPFLIGGFLASIANGLILEFAAPPAQQWTESFKESISKNPRNTVQANTAYFNTRDRRLWMIDRFDSQKPTDLQGVKITEERPDGTRIREYVAEKARFMDGQWWLFSPTVRIYDTGDNPVGQPVAVVPGRATVFELTGYGEKPIDFLNEIRKWDLLNTHEMWEYVRRHPGLSKRMVAEKLTLMHTRLAMPWACLVVTLFAVPAGARTGRQSALVGIFKTVAFFFGFYAATHVGLFLGMRRVLDPLLAAWLPNTLFLVAGTVMTIRMR